jgi:hypothetical protein
MKNENTKSMTTHVKRKLVLATCLILAALGPPAADLSRGASLNGSPPVPFNPTFTVSGICAFDVQVTATGKIKTITLPGGRFIFTAPSLYATFTNLSDPTKSVTLNLTGSEHLSVDANGNTIETLTGRNGFFDPSTGILLLVGNFTVVFDPNGNLIQGPTGNGQVTQVCDLID